MLSKIVEILMAFSLFAAVFGGKIEALSSKCAEAPAQALTMLISMAGGVCFWSGLMEIMAESGMAAMLTRALKKPIRLIYGKTDSKAEELLCRSFAANILGLGSAATPAGIEGGKRLRYLYDRGLISQRPLFMLTVVNTVSIQLIPATVAAARGALGAARPYDILAPVWLASIASFAAAVAVAKCMGGDR